MPTAFPRPATDHAKVTPDPIPHTQLRTAVERAEQRVAATKEKLARDKRFLRDVSVREKGIRERVVGRAVWKLVGRGGLEPATVDVIRVLLHEHLSPAEAAALVDTVFARSDTNV